MLAGAAINAPSPEVVDEALTWRHWLTVAVIAALVVGAIFFEVNVGMAAFAGAMLLAIARAAGDAEAVKRMPGGSS